MTPEEIQQLLGGYATGTLTEAEQQALFEAALHDQALFDALAREQSLRDLLRDPAARANLLAALEPPPARRFWTWRPIMAVAAMAALGSVAVVLTHRPRPVLVGQALPPANPIASLPPAAGPVGAGQFVRAKPEARPAPAHRIVAPKAPSAPQPAPAAALGAVSGAIVELPKVVADVAEAPKAKAEDRVAVTAAAPVPLPPVATARTSFVAVDGQPVPTPQFRMQVQAPGARQIFYSAAQRTAARLTAVTNNAPQPANLALRYTILRRDDSGAFVEVERSDLRPSDTVELRFTANTTGYLTVGDAAPVSLTAMEPYTAPPLPSMPAELKIIFAPHPERQAVPAAAITEVQYRDTYVANRIPGQPLNFTVKLP